MPKSHSQIMAQIEKLQKEAAALQSGVINAIKKQIAQHGLTAEHLFGGVVVSDGLSAKSKSAKPTASKPKAAKVAAKPAKFGDDQGNTWAGMGKRPDWLRAALDAGRSMEEFFLGKKTKAAAAKPKASRKASGKAAKAKPVAAAAAPVKVSAKPAGKTAAAKKAASKLPTAGQKAAPAKKVASEKRVPVKKASLDAGKPAAKRVVAKSKAVKKVATSPAQVDQASA